MKYLLSVLVLLGDAGCTSDRTEVAAVSVPAPALPASPKVSGDFLPGIKKSPVLRDFVFFALLKIA